VTRLATPALPSPFWSPIDFNRFWWSTDSRRVYFIREERGAKCVELHTADASTGQTSSILRECSPTFVELNIDWGTGALPNVRVLGDGAELIWFSERDGWGHLYLYDGSGQLKHQITSGPWVVRQVLRVDEAARQVYFTGAGREPGRDPYYRHLYRVNLDGSDLRLLTPEDADHSIRLSPDGRYLVDNFSRVDT